MSQSKNDQFQTSDNPEPVLGQAPGRKAIVPDALFILKRIRKQATSLDRTIKVIDAYIERLESL